MKQWFESEDFWINYAPIMYDDNLWEEAPTVADYVTKIAGLKKGDSVLDAACGVGRIAVELAALGMDVTGVDITKPVLEAAAQSAEDEGVSLTLLNQDLRTFTTDKKFDCAINLYTSFGYCDTEEEDLMILQNIARALKQGGTFIMECTSRETAILYWTPGEEFERAGYRVVTHFEVVGAWEGLKSQWTLYSLQKNQKQPVVDHTFIQRLYPATFLRNKLLEFGFSKADVYGDFDHSPYDEHARTMIIIGRK